MSQFPSTLTTTPGLLDAGHGDPYRPHQVLNDLAAWLEPRWLDEATADLVQRLYETALELLDPAERDQLSVAARRWTRECCWRRWDHPTLPFD